MDSFKVWLQESDIAGVATWMAHYANAPQEDLVPPEVVQQFKAEFERFLQFIRKWDVIGMEKFVRITGGGYFKVLYDFMNALYLKVTGKSQQDLQSLKKQAVNVAKLIPGSLLFGTATYVVPFIGLDMAAAGLIMMGLKLIQYLYWPFWAWASRNLENQDPNVAKKAQILIAAIPDQWKDILAKSNPKKTEWLETQLPLIFESTGASYVAI